MIGTQIVKIGTWSDEQPIASRLRYDFDTTKFMNNLENLIKLHLGRDTIGMIGTWSGWKRQIRDENGLRSGCQKL